MSKINKDALDFTTKVLAASDVSELENAKQVVEHSGFEDDVTAPILSFIDEKIEEIKAADNELDEVFNRKDVKDHIQLKVDEATAPLTDEISTLKSDKEEADANLKLATIDSIVSYALVLRKDKIDFEKVESSVSAYREELSSKSESELKDSLSELETEIKDTFSNSPSTTLNNEIEVENGSENPEGNTDAPDGEEAEDVEPPKNMIDFLGNLLKANKDDNEAKPPKGDK